MKKTTRRHKGNPFAGMKMRRWLRRNGMTLAIVVAALLIVVVIVAIIVNAVKSGAEKTRNQLASNNTPVPTETTEAIELAGVSDAQEPSTEEEPTTEVEEEPTEEVTEVTEEATEEPSEEATEEATEEEDSTEEAQPSEGAQPTEAQPTQQPTQQQPTQTQPTQQPTQTQPTQTQQQPTTGGTSWSWSYHNDNGVVTVSVTGDFPSDLDPNNPEAVHQWVMNHYGFDPMWFF